MSGIFNGDSIYKSGGGGGGYKDGGQLIDGDFIKVENNTVSSYDNVSRDPVNFYFEYEDGDVLNSVINFSTQINSTVNVYIIKNGIYYLLKIIGVNNVNIGNYVINITGEVFSIDPVVGELDPEFIELDNYGVVPCIKVNNLLWLCQSLDTYCRTDFAESIVSHLPTGWRLPTVSDFDELQNYFGGIGVAYEKLKSTSGWYAGNNGTNESRFNMYPNGFLSTANTIIGQSQTCYIMVQYTGSTRAMGLQYDGLQLTSTSSNIGGDVRAVFDLN